MLTIALISSLAHGPRAATAFDQAITRGGDLGPAQTHGSSPGPAPLSCRDALSAQAPADFLCAAGATAGEVATSDELSATAEAP